MNDSVRGDEKMVFIEYDRQKMKKYKRRDDGDFIERWFRKNVAEREDLEWGFREVKIDIKPLRAYNNQLHIVIEIKYDPKVKGVQDKITYVENFFMTRVDKCIVIAKPIEEENDEIEKKATAPVEEQGDEKPGE
jgi:hypothetical protein